MSVIWSGITEQGAVVPVQVDETGKVIATVGPDGGYVRVTGDIMTGPLFLSGDPDGAAQAATKRYVDSRLASSGPIAYGWYNPLNGDLVGANNISSVRKVGVGVYQFYFTEIPPSDNIAVVCNANGVPAYAFYSYRDNFSFTINVVNPLAGNVPVDASVSFACYWGADTRTVNAE